MSQPFIPHKFQENLIRLGVQQGALGMLLAPGMGKTACVYSIYKVRRMAGMVHRALVIAPLRVAVSTWKREQEKWTNFADIRVAVLHGPKKDELLNTEFDIAVINPEGLPWLVEKLGTDIYRLFEMLVVDESTQYKNPSTERFKLMRKMFRHFRFRYILTGSPAPLGLHDLWGQIYILDGGLSLEPTLGKYRQEYFDKDFLGYTWTPRRGVEDKIYAKIAPITMRLAAEDYIDLPPLVYNDRFVYLDDASRRTYDHMEELMFAEINGDLIMAMNAAGASNKCRQIANGGIYKEDGEYEQLHNIKTEAVKGLVEELSGQPCLLAYEYQHDLARLQTAFPNAPYLGGGVTPNRQAEIEDAWNSGQIPVLLVQPQSVAFGLNLQGVGSSVVWHSLTWNLLHYEQLIRRVWRQGQTERVVVHHIIMRGTIDEVVMENIRRKDYNQQTLLNALRDYARARLANLDASSA